MRQELPKRFAQIASSPEPGLAPAALMIARLEYPHLDATPYLDRLDAMGAEVGRRLQAAGAPVHERPAADDLPVLDRIAVMNGYLFEEQGFVGNRAHYEDPRNSCLNEVLDRRTGIPISLAVVYMEVARRAGLRVEGVNFPGHFLVCYPAGPAVADEGRDVIIDAFHGGARLSERDCRELLRRHIGDEAILAPHLLAPATKTQILVRMLLNLKHVYVNMHSFPQARQVTELLLALTPSALTELRDRGLLAYHLNDFSAALRDLQEYLRLASSAQTDPPGRDEQAQIWEHVKALRRRVASFN
ncbi:MAG TPA: transglutaminase-like domain-containing protein [Vicinamibacterales bacterium]|nr:transglutaminase-like domain-containing protein [Vicinamibacterales bacterium]